MFRWFVVLSSLTFGFFVANGCGKNYNFDGIVGTCDDPNDPGWLDPRCIAKRCKVDASVEGCDAGTDEDAGTSSARCSGTCVSNAPNEFAAPQLVYVGEPKAKYSYSCPSEVGAFGGREYRDLITPNPGCPACICGPIEGSCSARPDNIVVRAGTCNVSQPATVDFSAPENWDGSCTNVNAVAAGLECPPNSGIPCAQSVYSSTLLEPVQGCEPIPLPVPRATSDTPRWATMVISCKSTPLYETCEQAASTQCMPSLPKEAGWRYCARHNDAGVQPCPSSIDSPFSEQIIAYTDVVDTRKCTECACKASGGSCHGTLRVYKDNACSTNEALTMEGVTSEIPLCSNLSMPGEAIGSKELTDLTYIPGQCEPTGGLAIGTAYPDESTAVTWCCMPPPIDADAGIDASME